jgi:ComF family protein
MSDFLNRDNSGQFFREFFCGILNFFLPPRCLGCGLLVEEPDTLCHHCWKKLHFISQPFCVRCGLPFDVDIAVDAVCRHCIRKETVFALARTALCYDEGSKPLILRFKHADETHFASLFAKWMWIAGKECMQMADYLVPVPLHWRRLLKRQYNQAALLTLELAKLAALPAAIDLLWRNRATPPQGHLTGQERQQNVAGAFRVHPKWQQAIKGKRIVLVDDVMTSGATVHSCTVALLNAGASQVNVLTLARVVS